MTVFNIEKFNTYMTTILDDEDKEEAWKSEEHQKKLVEILKECGAKFSKKKKKKKKNGPKRGRNAYIFFCSETRKELKASNPDLPLREITSMLGKRWQELKAEDGDDFNRFKQLAEEDRERYRKEKKEFSETEDSLSEDSDSDSDSDKKKKKKKKKNGPKRGKNAYIIYSGAMRKTVKEENPQLNPAGVVSLLGKMWKDVKSENGEEYEKYTNLANADKERYLREVEELKSKVASDEEDVDIEVENDLEKVISEIRSEDDEELEEEETMPQEEKPKKKKKKEKKKKEKKKKKKKVTPYLLYAKSIREKIREENPDMTGDEIMLQLSQNWKNMETEEKNNWKKTAKEMEEGLA